MRNFTAVSPQVWKSKRFQNLPNDSARLLYLYLLTSPHQSSAGSFHLPGGYASTDLRWDEAKYHESAAALVAAELIDIDPDTEEVMILRWFRHNPPMNALHFKGTHRQAKEIASDRLRGILLPALDEAWSAVLRNMDDAPARAKAAITTGFDQVNCQRKGVLALVPDAPRGNVSPELRDRVASRFPTS